MAQQITAIPPSAPAAQTPTAPGSGTRRAVIQMQDVNKTFGDFTAVEDLTFEVYEGEIFGFIGPSGSGKTTTMRLITGILAPSSGTVQLLGTNPNRPTRALHEEFGYMPQLFVLYPNLSVYENLNFMAGVYGLGWGERRGRIRQALQFVELWDARNKLGQDISGGMQRRLQLAGAIIHNPRLLFVDEPTAGIDPVLRGKFWDEFRRLREAGRTIFVTTQYVGESEYCDRVGVIRQGKIVAVATPLELRRLAMNGDVVDLQTPNLSGEALSRLLAQPYVVRQAGQPRVRWVAYPTILRIHVQDASDAIPQMLQVLQEEGAEVTRLQEDRPSFDEVFIKLMNDIDTGEYD